MAQGDSHSIRDGTTAPVDSQLAHNHPGRGDTGGYGRGRATLPLLRQAAEGV
ncbi:hypothetical protein [Rhodococcus opacus]|uniref:hypothetical protein n=1 Tax=Rhodococcus opacus TaxID=37919 RepID=UPI001C206833|nr:hypothetical protein [Rhodococcus opacus]